MAEDWAPPEAAKSDWAPPEATAQKAWVPPEAIAKPAPAQPQEEGLWDKFTGLFKPTPYKSVLEGINAQPVELPPQQAAQRDALIEQGKQAIKDKETFDLAKREELRQAAKNEKYNPYTTLKILL